jgi:hypothetical protein
VRHNPRYVMLQSEDSAPTILKDNAGSDPLGLITAQIRADQRESARKNRELGPLLEPLRR